MDVNNKITKTKLNELYEEGLNIAKCEDREVLYTHYVFFVEYILDLSTYDDEISNKWGLVIHNVMNAIKNRKTFEYIRKSEKQYEEYLIVAQLLEKYEWIDWGTSIRGAFFEEYDGSKKILMEFPFTLENINIVLEWLDENAESITKNY